MSDIKSKMEHKPIFRDLTADDPDPETTVIESLCMNCGENGSTRLLLTKIPHYKDVIIMSFSCDHCGLQNNEIENGGKICECGVKILLTVAKPEDLNRQIVKSDYTSVKIPDLDFEIPVQSQKGEVTTVEGIIDRSIAGLEQDQPERREVNLKTAADIDIFLAKFRSLKLLDHPFTIIFEDITGECHVENPNAPLKDNNCTTNWFTRSDAQNRLLGIYPENEDALLKPIKEGEFTLEQLESEVLSFPTNCPSCNNPCQTNMKMTKIPHFKEVVIMATNCDTCGQRTNEVKNGGGIELQAIKIEVKVRGEEDFSRDILKSETCGLEIPELELEVGPAALGGRFTTVEGLLTATKEQLTSCTAITGDSADRSTEVRMAKFIEKLVEVLECKREVTLVLDDPAGNSYVQSLSDTGCDDGLRIIKYDRTFEQNEELGLNDMKVDNY